MENNKNIRFVYGFTDLLAHVFAAAILIFAILFAPAEYILYFISGLLLASVFLEKYSQVLLIINFSFYVLFALIFPIKFSEGLFEVFYIDNFTDNETIMLLNFIFFIIAIALAGLSQIMVSLKHFGIRDLDDRSIDYTLSTCITLFIVFSLILAFMLAQTVSYEPIYMEKAFKTFFPDKEPNSIELLKQGRLFAYLLAVLQFYTLFTIIYYYIYILMFLIFFSIPIGSKKIKELKKGAKKAKELRKRKKSSKKEKRKNISKKEKVGLSHNPKLEKELERQQKLIIKEKSKKYGV
ncbi:MAG: hypothetical protein ACTSRP_10475 [Candidatus Helarchaeota archaeon]